jgi:hypothetical protein
VTSGLFVSAVRNTWLLVVVSLLVAAANAEALDPERLWQALERRLNRRAHGPDRPLPLALRGLAAGALAVWLLLEISYSLIDKQQVRFLLPEQLSRGAVRFLREERPAGHLLNNADNSGYLEWCLAGEPPLFIDALNAYPDAVTRDYVDLMTVSRRGRELLAGDWLDGVILTTNRLGPSPSPLADYLDRDPRWMRVYADSDGVIWVRRTPEADRRWAARAATVAQTTFGYLEAVNQEPTP